MIATERWKEAQAAENEYWTGLTPSTVKQIFETNTSAAKLLQSWLNESPTPSLEIGVGGLGIGLLGFIPSIPTRIGIDPLPLVHPDCPDVLLQEINARRQSLRFVRASGESLPFRDASIGLVVCVNVLDHVRNAPQVLQEILRVLRPGGTLFLAVDTFSYLGWMKWHLWTRHRRANEIMVRAHPYRFLDFHVRELCRDSGFQFVRGLDRGPRDRWMGHSVLTPFLFRRP